MNANDVAIWLVVLIIIYGLFRAFLRIREWWY